MTTFTLEKRKTHHYRDGWSSLDEWVSIGSGRILRNVYSDEDEYGSMTINRFVCVAPDTSTSEADIEAALRSTFTHSNCRHDYDCCGCRSYAAIHVQRIDAHRYRVDVSSSCNY